MEINMKNNDFHCAYSQQSTIPKDISPISGYDFLQCNTLWEPMAQLSEKIRLHNNSSICRLPFDHTIEGEAMGGQVLYDDELRSSRAGKHICTRLEEIINLPCMDFSSGRLHQVLLACNSLKAMGRHVCLEISGPFTILDALVDVKQLFMALRKNIVLIETVLQKIGTELIKYIEEAQLCGVDIISYADPSVGVDIIGPKYAKLINDIFTCNFIETAASVLRENSMLLLCPRITYELLESEKIIFNDYILPSYMKYEDACIEMLGKAKISGNTCIKNTALHIYSQTFREIIFV